MNRKLLRPLVTIACVSMLAACGGGSGGSGGGDQATLSLADHWQRFQNGNPTLRMSGAQIEQAYRTRDKAASHDLYWVPQPLACEPGADDCGEPRYAVEVDPHEYEDSQLPPGSTVSFSPVLEHNDIRVAELRARIVYEDEVDGQQYLADVVTYGGWLDHTVFGVVFSAECRADQPGCSGDNPIYAVGSASGFTPYGVYSGQTPTGRGSATWTGVMVGMEVPTFEIADAAGAKAWANAGQPKVYLGEARVAIEDLVDPDVDVSFTNIRNVTEGTRHGDMIWKNLSVENGLFGSGDSEEFIAGMFTGPQQQEVGGEFQRDGIAGGFGARRR